MTTPQHPPFVLMPEPLSGGEPYALDSHPVAAYLMRLNTVLSRQTMSWRLDIAARLLSGGHCQAMAFPWHRLTRVHLLTLRATLQEDKAPQTVNLTIAAIRGVLKEAWRLGLMPHEQYMRVSDLPTVKGRRLPKGRALEQAELAALFRSCRDDPRRALGARDAALLAVLYGMGLRRAEAVGLDFRDYQPEVGALHIRHGKGSRERLAYTNTGSAQALAAWAMLRGRWTGPLFPRMKKHGQITRERISFRSVGLIVQKRAAWAGTARFTPHDLRRTFITTLLDRAVDLPTVQRLAGHVNLTTTALYDRRGERAKRAAMPLLPVPYEADPPRPPGAEERLT